MVDLTAIYTRTPVGLEEIRTKVRPLTREQRNLLILADGRKPLVEFSVMFGIGAEEMSKVVEPLVGEGLLVRVRRSAAVHQVPAFSTGLEAKLEQLVKLADKLFGKKADVIVHKLERAHGSWSELGAAVESSAKLARLMIDENKGVEFLGRAREILRPG